VPRVAFIVTFIGWLDKPTIMIDEPKARARCEGLQ
jgi:hypothetical protein